MKVKMKCADLENTHHIQGIEKTAFGGYVLTLENGKKNTIHLTIHWNTLRTLKRTLKRRLKRNNNHKGREIAPLFIGVRNAGLKLWLTKLVT